MNRSLVFNRARARALTGEKRQKDENDNRRVRFEKAPTGTDAGAHSAVVVAVVAVVAAGCGSLSAAEVREAIPRTASLRFV
jgi:hypothetical protein